ncbi:hypothetical protein BTN49_1220 [Candidatus Enterovibrio escicola]|uniref:Uncharacterized protein n=1 Tax=Candidatus Enterovibrio escicola TaxID=1927127 RepID=A0A2A5T4Z3_9GAMM|nr:hypothetical protein BTN49_1220 [Candidatus Enterovibrio escacola]
MRSENTFKAKQLRFDTLKCIHTFYLFNRALYITEREMP